MFEAAGLIDDVFPAREICLAFVRAQETVGLIILPISISVTTACAKKDWHAISPE
jgi:hypothetical protein